MFSLSGQSVVPQPFARILPRERIICQDPFIKSDVQAHKQQNVVA